MTKSECIGTAYQPLGGGYAYATLRVGLVVRNPVNAEIYIQPGDAETAMRANIEALDDISLDVECTKRGIIADMILADYFGTGEC